MKKNSYKFDACINVDDSDKFKKIANAISNIDVSALTEAYNNYANAVVKPFTLQELDCGSISTKCQTIGNNLLTAIRIYETYDSSLKEIIDDYLLVEIFNNKEIHFNEDGSVEEMSLDNLFKYFDSVTNGYNYGCNQNPFEDIYTNNPEYYQYLVSMMGEKYGLSSKEIRDFMLKVDGSATCTYARSVNDIIFAYKDRPDLFLETFGYPLYKENENGEMMLNTGELLIDYIVTSCCNRKDNVFINYTDGEYVINNDGYIFGNLQGYDDVDEFLELKTGNSNLPITCNVIEIASDNETWNSQQLKETIIANLNDGKNVSIGMCPLGSGHNSQGGAVSIPFYSTTDDCSYEMDGGHWITITDATNEGIIVDSWGERCLIKYEDLINDSYFNIYSTEFEVK